MTDLSDEHEYKSVTEFDAWLQSIADGTPPLNAGIEQGWTPKKINDLLKQPDIAELVYFAQMQADGVMVKAMFDQGKKGNMAAITTWLFNRQPHEWKDTRKVVVSGEGKVDTSTIVAAREAALALLGAASIEELQGIVETTADADHTD